MKDRLVKVLSNERIASDTYKIIVQTLSDFPTDIRGGQFVHLEIPDKTRILRRPFCIADYSYAFKTITIVYAVVGGGTEDLSNAEPGTLLKALFPLGKGFSIPYRSSRVVLVGGGLGAAVLPAIPATWHHAEYYTYLGFSTASKAILIEEMRGKSRDLLIATDDGSLGTKGYITDLLDKTVDSLQPDIILACGPEVMYKSLARVMEKRAIPTYISLEKRMGCGVGACLVCNCKITTPTGDKFLRACVDGPVFNINEVVL